MNETCRDRLPANEKPQQMNSLNSSAEAPVSSSPRKIFIVDDHPVFREGLVQVINSEGDLTVCGEAGDAEHALEVIPSLNPDLVLVDITLPGKSGMDLIKELRAEKRRIKLLVVSMHDEALYADRVLRGGGDGYVMKQEDPEEIVHAIRDVLDGRIYVSEDVISGAAKPARADGTEETSRPLGQLTDVELEVLELLGLGKTNSEIARQLHCGAKAVGAHCTRIMRKLKLKSINALIRYAVCWVETGKA